MEHWEDIVSIVPIFHQFSVLEHLLIIMPAMIYACYILIHLILPGSCWTTIQDSPKAEIIVITGIMSHYDPVCILYIWNKIIAQLYTRSIKTCHIRKRGTLGLASIFSDIRIQLQAEGLNKTQASCKIWLSKLAFVSSAPALAKGKQKKLTAYPRTKYKWNGLWLFHLSKSVLILYTILCPGLHSL